MPGCCELLLMLNPRPMSPDTSWATLPIHRELESGAYVPCWKTFRLLPVPVRSSYQRIPTPEPAVMLRLTTRASWSPKLRYARRYMRRSPSVSSCWLVPDCGTHVPPVPPQGALNAAVANVPGTVRVVLEDVVKST